jgi:hypothetical protein
MIYLRDLVFLETDRNELDQTTGVPDNTERAVLCVYQTDRGSHDAMQSLLKLKLAADRDDCLEQRMNAVAGVECHLKASLKLTQQVIQAQVRKERI